MNILMMMLRAPRPSCQDDMRAVAMPRWIRRGYDGLTFFGYIITPDEQEAEAFNGRFGSMKNHEMIHLYQARACHDSWLLFYVRYGWYWLRALPASRRLRNAGYQLNPFEPNVLFLFCGRRPDRIKGLLWEGNGFLLLYKRYEGGSLSWPRTAVFYRFPITYRCWRILGDPTLLEFEKAKKKG